MFTDGDVANRTEKKKSGANNNKILTGTDLLQLPIE